MDEQVRSTAGTLARSLAHSQKGFTLVELMVSALMGLVVVGMATSSIIANRELLYFDFARTRVNQNLRGAMDIISANAKEAGENLPESFPAVEVIDGGGSSDILVLRRNLLDEVLKVCQSLSPASDNRIYFATAGTEPGCSYVDNQHNFDAWQSYRTDAGGSVQAYVYSFATNSGEFFDYSTEVDTGSGYYIEKSSGAWSGDYVVGSSSVYIIEEWRFELSPTAGYEDMIQIVENQDFANPMYVTFDISSFNVDVEMADGTVVGSMNPGDEWTEIKAIEVTIGGIGRYKSKNIESELTGRFYPRNILSH